MDHAAFIQALLGAGVTHVVGIPDTETGPVFESLRDGGGPRLVRVCREGEAFAVAAGLWGGGAQPLTLIQSTGFFEAGDSLRSIAFEVEAPIDVVVGYRGHSGKLNSGRADTARTFLEPVLKAWGVEYELLGDDYVALETSLREGAARESGARFYLLPQ